MLLPEVFTRNTLQLMGAGRFSRFLSALDEASPVSIRVNPLKCPQYPFPVGSDVMPVPWCPYGWYLASRPDFTFDPFLHAGLYYVQEASSMFAYRVIDSIAGAFPVAMLDLCAAPGGKSTAALSALPAGSLLVSNDPVRSRTSVLAENIMKWGHDGCIVTAAQAADFKRAGVEFDIILCDVPCSGEGMFRKDPAAVANWSPDGVMRLQRLQRDIVTTIWPCLRPGGTLIYGTCTYNAQENEENVAFFMERLGAQPVSIPTEPHWGITGSLLPGFHAPVYRFIPGFTQGEGLFVGVLRKPGTAAGHTRPVGDWRSLRQTLAKRLNVVYDGHPGLVQRGRDMAPTQALALSAKAEMEWPQAPLDYAQALAYLRRESLVLPPDVPRGYVVVCYEGHRLGFVKNLGNRANNLYPQEWRIKSTHLPSAPPHILTLQNTPLP